MDRARLPVPRRDEQILGLPDGQAHDPRSGHRRWLHRPRNGGESGASRDSMSPSSRCSTRCWRRLMWTWPALSKNYVERHGVRLALNDGVAGFHQAAERFARGADQIRQDTPCRNRYSRDRREARHHARQVRRPRDRPDEVASVWMNTCARTNPDIFAVGDASKSGDGRMEFDCARRAGESPGTHRGGCDLPDAIHAYRGTQGTSIIGLFGGAAAWDGRQREDAQAPRRQRLREDLSLPEFTRRLLPRRAADCDEILFRNPTDVSSAAQALGEDGRGQAHQRACHGAPDGRYDLRSRRS
jgi:hypothetical protein